MELGIEIATGTFLLVFGLSFLINAGYWASAFKGMWSDSRHVFMFSLVFLICGVLMVLGHNLWVGDWRVIVTIVGWATLLKSIAFILAPRMLDFYANWSEKTLATWLRLAGVLWALGGAVVLYFTHVH